MKKRYGATRQVRNFIEAQPYEIQAEYVKLVERLEADGCLIEPFGKKLDKALFEMRLRRGRQVRVIYSYHEGDWVIGLHGFVKKTSRAPLRELVLARRMKRRIELGVHEEEG